jgi:hypothetical protein
MSRVAAAIAFLFLSYAPVQAETAQPLLVELFTAQGCSSCPPADEVLSHLAKRGDVVALAFHVDYWDSGGWRDKFALPESKARQQGYRRALHHDQVFTPQMVINGTVDTPGQVLEGVDKILTLLRVRTQPGPPVTLGRKGATLEVGIAGAPAWKDAVVWVAAFDAEDTADVKRGENRGKTIVNVNVVRELRNLGTYSGAPWTMTVDLSSVSPQQGVAVWLQPKDQSPVATVAMVPPS